MRNVWRDWLEVAMFPEVTSLKFLNLRISLSNLLIKNSIFKFFNLLTSFAVCRKKAYKFHLQKVPLQEQRYDWEIERFCVGKKLFAIFAGFPLFVLLLSHVSCRHISNRHDGSWRFVFFLPYGINVEYVECACLPLSTQNWGNSQIEETWKLQKSFSLTCNRNRQSGKSKALWGFCEGCYRHT